MLRILKAGMDDGLLFAKLAERSRMETDGVRDTVYAILEDVRVNGDVAVRKYTEKFDDVTIYEGKTEVTAAEIEEAYGLVDADLLRIMRDAKTNIVNFHINQKEETWFSTDENGTILGQMLRPLESCGVYVPGGTAPLPSTVLMDVVPAVIAGVEDIILCTPPGRDGKINPAILVAAAEAGALRIFKIGGAQAIAAMAYGTESVPKVDKIAGPGNIYVNTAKRMLYGVCGIDMFAGPSEIVIIADETADASFVAADMLSQAEHDRMASAILVTASEDFARKVAEEIEQQLKTLERRDTAAASINDYGAAIVVQDIDEAFEVVERIAPEHLELCIADAFEAAKRVRNAGAVFIGNYSSETIGDYYAGPNHTLPTCGTARFFSPLGVYDFMKRINVISYSKKAFDASADDVAAFADAEGLGAHANAIRIRKLKGGDKTDG